jgi:hypothetical protein
MKRFKVTQQEIVFVVFAALFAVFSAFLPGFLSADSRVRIAPSPLRRPPAAARSPTRSPAFSRSPRP